ncbi:ferritin light chain-like isoform X2 [Euwallacea fornicatus]|uniref:ferritin light chain-like isoform X2 n=1 Tax=Euwallacea fornicatus TaxID=995702 RepID=UPI00338F3E80
MLGIMRVLLLITIALVATSYASVPETEECYLNVKDNCDSRLKVDTGLAHCDAKYGAFDKVEKDLQRFTNSLIHRSFDFLLLATHYADHIKNRPGFEKLFRGLSDQLWEDGIDTIKYITSRGGRMNLNNIEPEVSTDKSNLELYELHSIGKALDIEKKLAAKVFELHKQASGRTDEHHDAEVAHHLEEKFMEKQRDTIRTLAGHAKDLNSIMSSADSSLGLYLFDNYLQE